MREAGRSVYGISRVHILLFILIAGCILLSAKAHAAEEPDSFVTQNMDLLPSSAMSEVAYGNGIYVAVGSGGVINKSADAENWTSVRTKADAASYAGVSDPSSFGFTSVAFGNGQFVVAGANGVILSSPDGTAWTQRTSNITTHFAQVKYLTFNGSSDFYAITTGKILKSSDGISWSVITPTGLSASDGLNQITVGNGNTRLAVGAVSGKIYSTTNGTTWSSVQPTEPNGFATNGTNFLLWMNDRYFFTNASCYIWTSTDLSSFTLVGAPFKQTASESPNIQMFDGFYDGSTYYLFGSAPSYAYGVIYTSTDAANWTMRPYKHYFVTSSASYVNGKYFVTGNEGMMVSSDGTDWKHPYGGVFQSVIHDGSQYIAVGQKGAEGAIWTSADLASWSEAPISGSYVKSFRSAAYGNGHYVALGDVTGSRTSVATSSDGSSWTVQNGLNDTASINSVVFGNGTFVAVGSEVAGSANVPALKTSTDGTAWTSPVLPANTIDALYSVTYENNQFIALGSVSGMDALSIWTSADGQTWTDRSSSYPNSTDLLINMVWDGSKYLVTGMTSDTYETFSRTSTDLSSWSGASVMPGMTYFSASTAQTGLLSNKVYMLVTDWDWVNLFIYYSDDQGATWQDTGVDLAGMAPYSLMAVNDQIIVSGEQQLIMSAGSAAPVTSYTLTYTAGTNGTVTGTSPQSVISGGNGTAVTAVPDSGYHFVKWSDDVATATRTDTNVIADISVIAIFAVDTPVSYTLTYTAGVNGTVTGTSPQSVISGGNGTAVTAVPDSGYHFVKWSDDVATATRTDTNVIADLSVIAIFAEDTPVSYTLTYTAGVNGTVTGTSPQSVISGGNGTAVTAVPDTGYHFVKWSDDVATATRTDTNVIADISVIAIFAVDTPVSYTLTYTAGANGTVTGTSPQSVISGGDGTAVTAVPDSGYHFVKWSDDVLTATRTDTNVIADISVIAIFAVDTPVSYTLTYAAGANGTLTGTSPQSVISGGNGTAVTAVPDSGYHFDKWSDNVATATRTDTNVIADLNVTAIFAADTPVSYTLTYTAGANGTVTGTTTQTVTSGGNGTAVTAEPDNGYHFVKWSDNVATATRTDTNVIADLSVTAIFAVDTPVSYTLTYTAGANGTVTGTTTQTVTSGGNATTVTAVPATGYHFVKWSDNVTTAARTDTNVTANANRTATFAINTYTVSFNTNGASAVADQTVNYNVQAVEPASPARSGYTFDGWYSDSGLTTRYNFTTTAVTSNLTLFAKWVRNIEATPPTQPANDSVVVLVNGKVENAGTATTTKDNDKTKTTIAVDQKKLEDKLEAEGQKAVVTIPVNTKSDVVVGELNGRMIKNMEAKQAVLEIKTEQASYKLPAIQIDIDSVSGQIGQNIDLQDIKVQVEIATPTIDTIKVVENAAEKGTFTIVAPPVEFTVKGTYGGKTIEVGKFNAYVERTIAIPDGVDPSKITTGVVVEPDGTVRHVPTKVVKNEGKYYAIINSLTNSTYSVVWHPIEFVDVASHWAKAAVNDMGSRMVIEGVGDQLFKPDLDITRAEFVAILVRGLGLKLESAPSSFSDISETAWYNSAVNTATAYHLISGYEDGTFRANERITREQAMLIVSKAMVITDLASKQPQSSATEAFQGFVDSSQISGWAKNGAEDCLRAGIVSGRNGSLLAPKSYITRAEVATIIQRLLNKSELI